MEVPETGQRWAAYKNGEGLYLTNIRRNDDDDDDDDNDSQVWIECQWVITLVGGELCHIISPTLGSAVTAMTTPTYYCCTWRWLPWWRSSLCYDSGHEFSWWSMHMRMPDQLAGVLPKLETDPWSFRRKITSRICVWMFTETSHSHCIGRVRTMRKMVWIRKESEMGIVLQSVPYRTVDTCRLSMANIVTTLRESIMDGASHCQWCLEPVHGFHFFLQYNHNGNNNHNCSKHFYGTSTLAPCTIVKQEKRGTFLFWYRTFTSQWAFPIQEPYVS